MSAFPALNGEVVTEAHTKACATEGHKTYIVDGVDQHTCPRCGHVDAAELPIEKFHALLKLEDEIRVAVAVSEFGIDRATRLRGIDNKVRIGGEFFRQVMEMTKDEQSAYGDYRMAALWAEDITMGRI